MDTHATQVHAHQYSVSSSHRRALRLRLASALVAALLVAAGAAGIGTVAPKAVESVFSQLHGG
jgi:hypothetical protein